MATVPVITGPKVLPGVTQPIDLPQTNSLLTEKGRTAQAVYNTGTAVKESMNQFGAVMEQQQIEADGDEAKKLDIELADIYRKAEFGDANTPGYRTLKGEDAVNGMKTVSANVQKQVEALRQKASNKRVREAFDMSAAQRTSIFNNSTSEHLFVQHNIMLDDTSEARLATAMNDAGANYGNDDVISSSLTAMFTELMAIGDRNGWSKEVYDAKVRAGTTDIIGSAIQGSLATGSTGRASQLLKTFAGDMEASKVNGYKTQIKNLNMMYAAQADTKLRDTVKDALTVVATGKSVANEAEITAQVKGTKYEETWTKALGMRQSISEFTHFTLPEQEAILRQFELQPTATADDVAKFSAFSKANTALKTAVDQGYGLQVAEELGYIQGIAPLDVTNPHSITARKQQADAASKLLGKTVDPMLPEEAKAVTDQLKTGSPKDGVKLLQGMSQGFGQDMDKVLNALTKSKNPEFAVAAARASEGVGGQDIAADVLQGSQLLAENGTSFYGLTPTNRRDAITGLDTEVTGMFAGTNGEPIDRLMAAADARYAALAGTSKDTEFQLDVYGQALLDVMGGAVEFNGSTVIPPRPDMTEEEFASSVRKLTDRDLRNLSVHGGVPMFDGNVAFSTQMFANNNWFGIGDDPAALESTGRGTYFIKDAVGNYLMDSTRNAYYELDLRRYNAPAVGAMY